MIDYTPVFSGQRKIADLAADITLDDLKAATDEQIDEMLTLVRDLSDAQAVAVAADPEAEGGAGWNVGHLIAHVTASSEEGAAVSSVLARGIGLRELTVPHELPQELAAGLVGRFRLLLKPVGERELARVLFRLSLDRAEKGEQLRTWFAVGHRGILWMGQCNRSEDSP